MTSQNKKALDWLNSLPEVVGYKQHRETIRAALHVESSADNVQEWVKATPHDTYEGLKTQFSALKNMINSMGKQLSHYQDKNYSLSEARLKSLEESLESERDMNAQLTAEIAAISQTHAQILAKVEALKKQNTIRYGDIQYNAAIDDALAKINGDT